MFFLSFSFSSPLFRIADAEENLGESEVREAHLAKALYFIRISDKVNDHVNVTHYALQKQLKILVCDLRRKLWSN